MISRNSIILFYKNSTYLSVKFSTHYSSPNIPSQAHVVIAGAGVVANSVAYHLVQNGWKDVMLIEQGTIGSGTSHFGSGTLGLFKPIQHRNLIWYSIKLYKELQQMGYDLQMKKTGSINIAQTKDRLIALKRRMAYNIPTGLHCELVSKDKLQEFHPYLRVDDIEGAVWVPEDGVIDPTSVCDTLASLAQQGGAKYIEYTSVKRILTKNRRVYAIETDKGNVFCDYFVNCTGMWARELGLQCDPPVSIPAYPAQHFYATTGPLPQVNEEYLPIVRDYDAQTYIRSYGNGLMVGWFELEAKPAFEQKKVPKNWKDHITKDFNHFRPLWEKAVNRVPMLKDCTKTELTNSPDNFTPDGRWILGESSEVKNYFVACGMNGNSLQGAGGIGKAVADWIIEGKPKQDLLPFNVQRFLNVHNSRLYLQQRTKEVVGRHYSILYPFQCEYKYARKLRCSPLYSVLETKGAVFGIKMAYERALYFDSTYKKGDKKPEMPQGSYFKPKFFDFMKEEYLACKEGVGVIDMSSFSKILLKSGGLEIVEYLQRLCANDIDIPLGTIIHTGMHNERGGYENDCMLIRQSENCFFMISPTSQQTRVFDWVTRNLPNNSTIDVNDVTSMYTVINVVGPKAVALLSELSNTDMKFAPFLCKKVNVGYASDVMVMSFTHTGEPGFCLYIPSEYALHVYYKLMTVGRDFGVRDVGTFTQRLMRIERFIPFWAEELNSFTTAFEAGIGFTVRLEKKENFTGKAALQKQKDQGVKKQLVFFYLNDIDHDEDVWPWGGEPIYRNNEYVGHVTSSGYGFAANKLICLGYIRQPKSSNTTIVTSEYILAKNAKYEIDIAGHRFRLTPHLRAPIIGTAVNQNSKYRPTAVKYNL
ncbi:pyruvate dehydrogenase phosphatase regulatory subunit, mitochondrial-like [Diorhabda sublineata]|uniref:pyruvate dehydrogenase phosphatase regulatory subunit, mitochondrial-like n=1 Tax=Diorhabda sublineata TaxID=1163346 RepID=UPI0024E0C881|nr:pyruvate dehydrogenase phosphatase regulatory subunit, mitochondrial-like [Diorhabda sublineata]